MTTKEIRHPALWAAVVVALGLSLSHASPESAGNIAFGLASDETAQSESQSTDSDQDSRLARLLKEASFSPGVNEVARMARAGTDSSILIAHVQASDIAYKLRPDDVAHLNENDVPDSVIASMIVRGAEVRAQKAVTPAPAVPQQIINISPVETPKVVFVPAPGRPVSEPVSTVTVIGSSHPSRGLHYRNHFYSGRNFYSGTYGRVYSRYGHYAYYGPSYRHGWRACR